MAETTTGRAVRCEKHGLLFNPDDARGCVLCRREAGVPVEPRRPPSVVAPERAPTGSLAAALAVTGLLVVSMGWGLSALNQAVPGWAEERHLRQEAARKATAAAEAETSSGGDLDDMVPVDSSWSEEEDCGEDCPPADAPTLRRRPARDEVPEDEDEGPYVDDGL